MTDDDLKNPEPPECIVVFGGVEEKVPVNGTIAMSDDDLKNLASQPREPPGTAFLRALHREIDGLWLEFAREDLALLRYPDRWCESDKISDAEARAHLPALLERLGLSVRIGESSVL